jgi:hypothetical protein
MQPQAYAADVGGFLADPQRAKAMAAGKAASNGCSQLIARAASDTWSLGAYRAALCYLQAETSDVIGG